MTEHKELQAHIVAWFEYSTGNSHCKKLDMSIIGSTWEDTATIYNRPKWQDIMMPYGKTPRQYKPPEYKWNASMQS